MSLGYRIQARRYRTAGGELDLVAESPDGVLVFIEVKARSGQARTAPLEAVHPGKQRRLALAAAFEYLTARLSDEVLLGWPWLSRRAHAREARLWRWHCEEEVGHRHVVRDIAAASGVGLARRTGCLLLATLYLGTDVAQLLTSLLWHDLRRRIRTAS